MVRLRVHRLALVDFRNYAQAEFEPGPRMNLLLGPNGAGKTNALEALHLLVTGLSPRAGRDQEMARWGCSAFSVRGEVEEDAFPGDILAYQVRYTDGRGKTVSRAGKARTGRTRTAALGGAVVFSPDDLALVKGGPGGRRGFLDSVAAKSMPRARGLLRGYERALAHRNRLLAEIAAGRLRKTSFNQLPAWTDQLIELGAEVLELRLTACEELAQLAAAAYAALGGTERLVAAYESTVLCGQQPAGAEAGRRLALIRQCFRKALEERAADEAVRGTTLAGPHRDDLLLSLGPAPARLYASQGQQRAIALALRLAETNLLRRARAEKPLLLLDDVFSELDQRRREALLAEMGELDGQTVLTASDQRGLPADAAAGAVTFAVHEGTIRCA